MSRSKLLSSVYFVPTFEFILEGNPIRLNNRLLARNIVALVLGKMWKYQQGSSKAFTASMLTISKDLGISVKSVERSISVLEKFGFVLDLDPHLRHAPHRYKVNENAITNAHFAWEATLKKKAKTVALSETPKQNSPEEVPVADTKLAEKNDEMIKRAKRRMKSLEED